MRPGNVEMSMGEVAPDGRLGDGSAGAFDRGDGSAGPVDIDEADGAAPGVEGAGRVGGVVSVNGVDGVEVDGVEVDVGAGSDGVTSLGTGLAHAAANTASTSIRARRGIAIGPITPLWPCRFRRGSTVEWDLWVGVVQRGQPASYGRQPS
jgi:hypothetical protein